MPAASQPAVAEERRNSGGGSAFDFAAVAQKQHKAAEMGEKRQASTTNPGLTKEQEATQAAYRRSYMMQTSKSMMPGAYRAAMLNKASERLAASGFRSGGFIDPRKPSQRRYKTSKTRTRSSVSGDSAEMNETLAMPLANLIAETRIQLDSLERSIQFGFGDAVSRAKAGSIVALANEIEKML